MGSRQWRRRTEKTVCARLVASSTLEMPQRRITALKYPMPGSLWAIGDGLNQCSRMRSSRCFDSDSQDRAVDMPPVLLSATPRDSEYGCRERPKMSWLHRVPAGAARGAAASGRWWRYAAIYWHRGQSTVMAATTVERLPVSDGPRERQAPMPHTPMFLPPPSWSIVTLQLQVPTHHMVGSSSMPMESETSKSTSNTTSTLLSYESTSIVPDAQSDLLHSTAYAVHYNYGSTLPEMRPSRHGGRSASHTS